MKNIGSKISIAFVFGILGFLVTYQLKTSYSQTKQINVNTQNAEIIKENEGLVSQKKDYENKLNELQKKIDEYEKASVGRNENSKLMLEQLEKLKEKNGLVDLQGTGIIIYLTPKTSLFTTDTIDQAIDDTELLSLVNELYAAEAEAISINDIRLNQRTGIRVASNAIRINNERIPYNKQVVIKAIGDKKVLESAINFPGNIPERLSRNCDITWELKDNIDINKDTSQDLEFKYAKPVKKE